MYRQRFPRSEISPAASLGHGVSFESSTVEIGSGVRAIHTAFCDQAHVFGGSFYGTPSNPCRVAGETHVAGDPLVQSSVLCCASIRDRPLIINSGIFERAHVYGNAQLNNVTVKGYARVYGDAVLDGTDSHFTVSGQTRICTGIWRRPPRVVDLGFCVVTEGPPGQAMVDCTLQPVVRWLKIGERYARRRGEWSTDQAREVIDVLFSFLPLS